MIFHSYVNLPEGQTNSNNMLIVRAHHRTDWPHDRYDSGSISSFLYQQKKHAKTIKHKTHPFFGLGTIHQQFSKLLPIRGLPIRIIGTKKHMDWYLKYISMFVSIYHHCWYHLYIYKYRISEYHWKSIYILDWYSNFI